MAVQTKSACDCIKDMEAKVKTYLEKQNADKSLVTDVTTQNLMLILAPKNDGRTGIRTMNIISYNLVKKKSDGGLMRPSKKTIPIRHNFCPMCGRCYDTPLDQPVTVDNIDVNIFYEVKNEREKCGYKPAGLYPEYILLPVRIGNGLRKFYYHEISSVLNTSGYRLIQFDDVCQDHRKETIS